MKKKTEKMTSVPDIGVVLLCTSVSSKSITRVCFLFGVDARKLSELLITGKGEGHGEDGKTTGDPAGCGMVDEGVEEAVDGKGSSKGILKRKTHKQ